MSRKSSVSKITVAFTGLLVLVGVLSFNSNARITNAQSTVVIQVKELIIQVPGLNEKNLWSARKNLEGQEGVTFQDYCFANKVIMLHVDRDLQSDNAFVEEALNPLNLTFLVKEGTITQVQNACADGNREIDLSSPTETE